ncbi:MAG: RluA family pseudouridine synthase [Burkholderiales bacterium]|nr:RluA family pseudouridine synthase [Burkholderiales bacterium]
MTEALKNYSLNGGGRDAARVTVPADCAGLRLDQALARMFPGLSRTRLARRVLAGEVTVDGRAALPRQRLFGGERVVLAPGRDPDGEPAAAESMALAIVYEDEALLVLDKPAGLVVHPGAGNRRGTLLNALLAHAPDSREVPRAGIVHRLDKDTSGLLVVAKTLAAHTELVRQLAGRTVRREYLAVVHGRVARPGTISAPIGRHPRSRIRMAVVARGRHAVTHFEVIERFPAATLLRCRLETGRTHQIRVHLQSAGHPLVGDPTYGSRAAAPPFPRQALHAERLALRHPATGTTASWHAPLPEDMRRLIEALKEPPMPAPAARVARPRKEH